jgi:hypothetical protein
MGMEYRELSIGVAEKDVIKFLSSGTFVFIFMKEMHCAVHKHESSCNCIHL